MRRTYRVISRHWRIPGLIILMVLNIKVAFDGAGLLLLATTTPDIIRAMFIGSVGLIGAVTILWWLLEELEDM